MPKGLSSVEKKITRKRGKNSSLHENSRDLQRLRRATARADKLGRIASARAKAEKVHLHRVAFFQQSAKEAAAPIEPEMMHLLIQRYLKRHDEEIEVFKAQRRPGRPPNNREILMEERRAREENEYSTGFWVPDMEDERTLDLLQNWNEQWASLSTLGYVRLTRTGTKTASCFPPNGKS